MNFKYRDYFYIIFKAFMIVDFGMAPDTDLAGYYAGENQFLCVAIYA